MQNLLNKSSNIRGTLADVTLDGNWKHVLRPIQAEAAPEKLSNIQELCLAHFERTEVVSHKCMMMKEKLTQKELLLERSY